MQTFFLLLSLLVSLLITFTLEKKTAKRYLLGIGFLFGLSLVLSVLLTDHSTPLLRGLVSFGLIYSLVTGLALLFHIYVNRPNERAQ